MHIARLLFIGSALAIAGCGGGQPASGDATAAAGGTIQINGAGASFPNPIYSKWFSDYHALHPNVQINYQPVGSGAGIRQMANRTVFFGASDQPMTDEQLKAAPGAILHLPTVLGAVVPIYNLPGVTGEIKFSGAVLADIVLGKITKWNDAALAALNPGLSLPATDIAFVHRSEGSGTTYIFVDYLAKVSPELKSKVGVSSAVSWPVGVGGKGSEGVSALVSQTPGSLGYVELVYALQNKIAFGSVQNRAGTFVKPSVESVTAAAASAAPQLPADFRVSITDPPGKDAYPIASFTWLLFYEAPSNNTHARTMVEFMKWALTDGQAAATAMGYAPLPKNVVELELAALERIKL